MTRQHFAAIALVLSQITSDHSAEDKIELRLLHVVKRMLADTLATFNPQFDRARFLAACEPKEVDPECAKCGVSMVGDDEELLQEYEGKMYCPDCYCPYCNTLEHGTPGHVETKHGY